jgi:hypothetical protein
MEQFDWCDNETQTPQPLIDKATQDKLIAAGWLPPDKAIALMQDIKRLRDAATLDSWRLNPDRMGQ